MTESDKIDEDVEMNEAHMAGAAFEIYVVFLYSGFGYWF